MATYNSNIPVGVANARLYLELTVDSQSATNNTTTLRYRTYLKGSGLYDMTNTSNGYLIIDGKRVYDRAFNYDLRASNKAELASGTTTINHDADGTKTIGFKVKQDCSVGGTWDIAGSMTLPTLARRSTFEIYSYNNTTKKRGYVTVSADLGEYLNFVIDTSSYSYRHQVTASIGGDTYTVLNKNLGYTDFTWQIPSDWLNKYFKNNDSRVINFTLTTYSENTVLGSQLKSFIVNAGVRTPPSITQISISEANSNKTNILGATPYYQLLSTIKVSTEATGADGATIQSIVTTINGQTRTGKTVYFSEINASGNVTVNVKVTDSRGQTATKNKIIKLEPYKPPSINHFSAFRDSDLATNASVKLIISHTAMNGKNPLTIQVGAKEANSYTGYTQKYTATNNVNSFNKTLSIGGGYEEFKAYNVRVVVADKFRSSIISLATLTTSQLPLVVGADDPVVGVGKIPTIPEGLDVDGAVQVNGDMYVKSGFFRSGFTSAGELMIKNTPIDAIIENKFKTLSESNQTEATSSGVAISLDESNKFRDLTPKQYMESNATSVLFELKWAGDVGEVTSQGATYAILITFVPGATGGEYKTTTSTQTRQRKTDTVRRGEGLWSIANRNGVTVNQLKTWNNLGENYSIHPGQSLYVEAPISATTTTSTDYSTVASSTYSYPYQVAIVNNKIKTRYGKSNTTWSNWGVIN